MKNESISIREAQALILNRQNLIGPCLSPLEIIEHLGYIQIDTISVVERAHHHVFWTRNQEYLPSDLEELVRTRKVFEYWSHAASYLPMSEYRFSLPMKQAFQKTKSSWFPRDSRLMNAVKRRIRDEGPLRSKDFENTKKGRTGWWDWKPAKKALERLFLEGQLEITRRDGFQKVYDIPERVIPASVNTSMPSTNEYIQFLIKRTLRHHGIANVNEMAYLRKKEIKSKVARQIEQMQEAGEIVSVKVGKIDERYFAFSDALNNIPKPNSKALLLSPFDNFVIHRKRLKTFFSFDYQIECYVPEAKRKYGYFCLPLFVGAQAIARIDCKAHRSEKKFIINSIHYENGINKKSMPLQNKIKPMLKAFAKFNKCKLVD